MARKILRRCSLCGQFHASFLVTDDRGGKAYLCAACWKATQTTPPRGQPPADTHDEEDERPADGRTSVS